ncbi:hypothetical protein QYE76_052684 [Lolium multiflorum]|uniref:DDE Tnp4 domain-containing protein n=1 Tax=Lolium multiflorum TaxID=4521 RepID=A0AAD8WLT1_LOLMU|nr:hypothetical protein QYE76_052684 [Lolium multiflorum]
MDPLARAWHKMYRERIGQEVLAARAVSTPMTPLTLSTFMPPPAPSTFMPPPTPVEECDATTPTPPPPSRRSAAVLVVGSVVAARKSRIVLGVGSGAYLPTVSGPNVAGCAALPRHPRPVRSIAPVGFFSCFRRYLCAAIDQQFVPTQMDMWHMVKKFRAEVVDSSSDEESDQSTQTLATTAASMIHEFISNPGPVHQGSVKGRSKNLPRNRVAGQACLHNDYFHLTNPVFPEKVFRHRYMMSRDLFLVILRGVRNYDPYFQKCSAAIRMLSYGMSADIFDEYLRMGESTCLEAMYRLMEGKAPQVSYEINGNEYDKPYYLADGIYPDWATLVKTVRKPNSEKTRRFAKMQESCKKDVERGFGVLQAWWAIVRHPTRTWSLKTMHEVMTCCVIVHNMIVENERPDGRNENHWKFQGELVAPLLELYLGRTIYI